MTVATSIHAPAQDVSSGDGRFFRACITVMAVVLVSGFVVQLAAGRSSFSAPLIVHMHAVAFMGWVAIVVSQAWLAGAGSFDLHRRLGRIAMVWTVVMLVLATMVVVAAVRTERVPFFFQKTHFVVADLLTLVGAVGMFFAAVRLRKRRDWHPRLQVGAFMLLMGPGVGRIIPMPLLKPYAFEIAAVVPAAVVLVCAVRDWRATGRVHPAWWWSIGVLLAAIVLARVVSFSPLGDALFDWIAAGSPAAGTDGRAYPPPPPMP